MWRIEKYIHRIDVTVCVNDRKEVLNGKRERVYVIIPCGKKILSYRIWNGIRVKRRETNTKMEKTNIFFSFHFI